MTSSCANAGAERSSANAQPSTIRIISLLSRWSRMISILRRLLNAGNDRYRVALGIRPGVADGMSADRCIAVRIGNSRDGWIEGPAELSVRSDQPGPLVGIVVFGRDAFERVIGAVAGVRLRTRT